MTNISNIFSSNNHSPAVSFQKSLNELRGFFILPFPALDGGRLLFLAIEKIKGSPVSSKISSAVHGAGMTILLSLMLFITYRDILKLF